MAGTLPDMVDTRNMVGWLQMTCTPVTGANSASTQPGQPHCSGSLLQIEVPGGRCLSAGVFTGWRSSLYLDLDREYKQQSEQRTKPHSIQATQEPDW